jgi:acetyl-CoA carboxylase biotin carboxylase subunit
MFKRILVANRGEIAVRIIRACRDLNIEVYTVHSTADAESMHVRLADHSICVGGPSPTESYLSIPALLEAASLFSVDAIHPGIGFLAENANFARMVEKQGMVFIGPSPEHIDIMGNKIHAKKMAQQFQLPLVPDSQGPLTDSTHAHSCANTIQYPVLIKAAGGGGGRGMRIVHEKKDLEALIDEAKTEALQGFGDNTVFMEKYLTKPRHIEIQMLADGKGNALFFPERDCSVQRRYQKLIEESPCLLVDRKKVHDLGVKCAKALASMGYKGVGTLEFLYENNNFYFIEMNTRIQVEHTVSEVITGIDLIAWQIRIASGETLSLSQDDITPHGHAIECRINAEDSETFAPQPGHIETFLPSCGPGIRVDSGIYNGSFIPPYYDSLIAKIIAHGTDRPHAIQRMKRALAELVITGITCNIQFHQKILNNPTFIKGDFHVHWLEQMNT